MRDLAVMTLEAAVHKMTGLPAEHLGFKHRGLIKPGYRADLVLLDPDAVADRATTADPFLLSQGVRDVWVNGEAVLRGGESLKVYPGLVIRRVMGP